MYLPLLDLFIAIQTVHVQCPFRLHEKCANAKREKEKALTQFVSSVSGTEAYEFKWFVAETFYGMQCEKEEYKKLSNIQNKKKMHS